MRLSAPTRNHAEIVQAVVASSNAGARAGFAASWRRSMIHHKLDPARARVTDRLTAADIAARREAAGLLLRVATPVLDRLARAACEAGCAVFLSDAEGLVLEERMREADRRAFHGSNLAPGSDWSEGREGTNGIGTCLAEGRPVTVWRDQHFRATNTGLTCMGAPVFGARGELAGVIDVSSAREDMTEGYARLVALTVQDAASRIEADLFRASFEGARILSTGAAEESPQGVVLLALDRDDLVIGATRAARRQLGLDEAQMGRVPATDLFGARREAGQGALAEAQRAEMVRALARAGGNVSAAARDLGIGRATFYRKAKALGLSV
ncbi:sigma-54-dependent Fis family transcriptional regulator [Rhodobacter capsulatus]|uniref:GAF domain-containing protein n=1 Tax=Rhodobacter capsulatus TaxID=1061 RepID=UPI0006DD24E2|nr:GAF domain-containing protein [Rhodobacter capsulatus]KQB17315.1 transcriptional regulator [Rhodobacter capsulatus]KQB17717.1 transcriptional regulator [Rhodobacter capsulatus]PZX27275.1 regulatory Fis family protein [Rhodobacter capsulatus]QNR64366.1 sigma-54-dependent Fis family transcriptional regulator [Rhodobacter capsulatus]